jgi:RNA recognition motif-containing protein
MPPLFSYFPYFSLAAVMEEDLRVLYVGNLDSRATESFISDIFSSIGPVKRCKLITGREHLDEAPYCFVEFEDHKTASKAIAAMNGRTIFDKKIKVNWRASNASMRKDLTDVNCTEVSELAERIEMSLSVSQASQKEVHETEKKDSTTSPSETCTTANSTGGEREPSVEYTSDRKRFSKEGHSRCMPGYDALRILYKYSSWFE